MRALPNKLKPANGFSYFFHLGLVVLLPALLYVLVKPGFYQLAIIIVLLSKWRMLAVRPRYWLANIRYNAVDMMIGISAVIFMATANSSNNGSLVLFWAAMYGLWLLFIKPGSSVFLVSIQALLAQLAMLTAMFMAWVNAPLLGLVVASWAICYLSARHFFTSFEEPHGSLYAHTWGYFAAAMVWVLSHWLLFYGFVAQPALLLTVLAFGVGGIYYLEESDRLSVLLRRQFVFIMVAIVVVVIVFSDWGDKTV